MAGAPARDARERFAADELAIVLSHYDLGVIQAIREYARGSRKAPKLHLRAAGGEYLLKRRAAGHDDPFKVAFCHWLQVHLAQGQFPLPHLVGTRGDNNSMLQFRGRIYELFEYIKGTGYDNSLEATYDAGKTLALFHKLLADHRNEYQPPRGSYHAARSVTASLENIPQALAGREPAPAPGGDAYHTIQALHAAYHQAGRHAHDQGLDDWPMQIVHSDWHPGNMLFRGQRVVAVIDYDSARLGQRVLDVANGALQFSILGGGNEPSTWPDYIDESRFKRFLRGYEDVPDGVLSRAELAVILSLMIEALIAESVIPVAATGAFARMQGLDFLRMVRRKVAWLTKHRDRLVKAVQQ